MIKEKEILKNISSADFDREDTDWRLKLDENENIYGIFNSLIYAIKNMDFEKLSKFSNPNKIIEKLSFKYNLKTENVLLFEGYYSILRNILDCYIKENDEILTYEKINSNLEILSKLKNIKINSYGLAIESNHIKEIFSKNISENTKVIYISSPNEITGELYRISCIEPVIQEHKDILFIIDCNYITFSSNVVLEDYIDLARKYENVIVIKSFSYDFTIAGFDIGILFSNSQIVKTLSKINRRNNLNQIALECLPILLNDEKNIENIKDLNYEAKKYFIEKLNEKGFKTYNSESNFILCDFSEYRDFYYQKFKNNGVITKKFDDCEKLKTCLRITVPKIGGVKYIIELLDKKDMIIFNIDGLIFDVRNSYMKAIIETVKYFSNNEIEENDVYKIKKMGDINSRYDVVRELLKEFNLFDISMDEIITVFQNLFYNSKDKTKKYLIDNEKLTIPIEKLEELSKRYDLVIFTERFREEVKYSFEKNKIDKFFNYYVTSDDLPKNMLKPHPMGVMEILKNCPHNDIKYVGSNIEDIISGNLASIDTVGVVQDNMDYNSMVNNFRHLGVKNILNNPNEIFDFFKNLK